MFSNKELSDDKADWLSETDLLGVDVPSKLISLLDDVPPGPNINFKIFDPKETTPPKQIGGENWLQVKDSSKQKGKQPANKNPPKPRWMEECRWDIDILLSFWDYLWLEGNLLGSYCEKKLPDYHY